MRDELFVIRVRFIILPDGLTSALGIYEIKLRVIMWYFIGTL